jgi:LPXTG-site transpeptidase (sortase) family protein
MQPDTKPKAASRRIKLSHVNSLLLVLVILINGYVILAPALPALLFRWDNRGGTKEKQLTALVHTPVKASQPQPAAAPQPNHVIIPSMLLNQPILEGPVRNTYSILEKGIWRWPLGSTPDKGSNTVLIGHRFTYTNPKGIFYYLNKVSVGDEIGLWWSNKEYIYKVSSITEVPPTDVAIEDATPDARLTLFTCTPLWNPHDRLVVVAELETKDIQ